MAAGAGAGAGLPAWGAVVAAERVSLEQIIAEEAAAAAAAVTTLGTRAITAPTQWSEVPHDILELTGTFLPRRDIYHAGLSCKSFQESMLNSVLIWKELFRREMCTEAMTSEVHPKDQFSGKAAYSLKRAAAAARQHSRSLSPGIQEALEEKIETYRPHVVSPEDTGRASAELLEYVRELASHDAAAAVEAKLTDKLDRSEYRY